MSKAINEIADKADQYVEKGKKAMESSKNDWMQYVESHPLQTLVFGVIGFYALKGLIKS